MEQTSTEPPKGAAGRVAVERMDDIEKSFHTSRLPRLPWSLLLVIYAPFGLFLTLLRACMSLQAVLILFIFPEGAVKRFLLRVFFGVLGIVVLTDSFHRKGSQTKVFISNKLSYVDHIVLHLALDCITVSTGAEAPPLHCPFPHRRLSSTSANSLETEAKQLPEFDESRSEERFSPFVIQPESMATNGSHTLLQFSNWPCSLASNIQPIALTAKRPFGITLSTVQSSGWWDLFWTLVLPATVYRVKLLAPMERREGEEVDEFCERVQASLREELKLQRAEFTMEDVTTWLEARKKPFPVPTSVPQSTCDAVSDEMVQQVATVMPQVPVETIRKDLLSTKSVDATVTNLLEGVVAYDPLPPAPLPAVRHTQTHHTPSPAPSLKSTDLRPRKYFSPVMEAMHRQLSLDERKTQLLQNARRKYIEKHGLNVNT